MSIEKGERIHSFRVGKTWFNIWRNQNSETGQAYTTTNVTHSYQDKDSGTWKPSRNFSDVELADLETGAAEARRRLRIHDAELEKKEPEQELFQKKVAKKRATKSPAKGKS